MPSERRSMPCGGPQPPFPTAPVPSSTPQLPKRGRMAQLCAAPRRRGWVIGLGLSPAALGKQGARHALRGTRPVGGRGKGTPPRTPKNARRAPALRAHGAARHARPTLSDLKGGERPRDARARPARRGGGRRACWTGCACPFFVLAWKRECCPRARARTRAAAPARARQTPQAAWCDAHTRHRERAAAVAPARAPSPAARQPLSSRHSPRGAPRPRAPPGATPPLGSLLPQKHSPRGAPRARMAPPGPPLPAARRRGM